MMATFFGLMSSRGFLWFQLAIFVWQAIRSAATMRLPWALLTSAMYKIFRRKEFDNNHFILLATDYNDTADSKNFCRSYNEKENHPSKEFRETSLGESTMFCYKDCYYIADREKAADVRLLIIGELKNVPIVKEYKVVNGFAGVWTLCSADEAIRMCLASKRFRLCFRKTVSLCWIEHMPLITDTYSITKVFSGVPLYLNANGNEQVSSVVTLMLIILDFTYNIWSPVIEMVYLLFVRSLQLILSHLSTNFRFLVFYLLSNFDNRYLPCSISDFKVKITRTREFYTTDNTILNSALKQISGEAFDEVDATLKTFKFQAKAFKVDITKTQENNNGQVEFELKLSHILWREITVTYKMTQANFKTYIGCWTLLEKDCIGLVQMVEKGILFRTMHLFGFEETIDLFWGSTKVNVYKVEVENEHRYLIAGEKHKKFIHIDQMESPTFLATANK